MDAVTRIATLYVRHEARIRAARIARIRLSIPADRKVPPSPAV